MKKLLLPVVSLIFTLTTDAQQLYFRGGLGYAISHGGVAQSTVSNNTTSVYAIHGSYSRTQIPGTNIESFDLKRSSYTAGLQGVLAVGAMLNKNVGIDIAVNIGLATRNMESAVYLEQPALRERLAYTQKADMPVFIAPSLVIQTDTASKIIGYARGGVVFPVKSGLTQEVMYTQDKFNPGDNTWVRNTIGWTEDFNMRLNPGVSGSLGIKYKANKGVTIWAELYLLSMNLYFKQSELTSYTVNGASELSQLTQEQKITNYEFKADVSGTTNVVPTYQVPYSNFALHAGIMVDLN